MNDGAMWRRLIARRSWPRSAVPAAEQQEDATLPDRELHQRRLNRLLTRGLPIWTEDPLPCDRCGRRLLTGERAFIMRRDDELLLSCPLCEEPLLGEGYFYAGLDSEKRMSQGGGESLTA